MYALDGTLQEPFLPRHADGSLQYSPVGDSDAEGVLDVVDLDIPDAEDDQEGSEASVVTSNICTALYLSMLCLGKGSMPHISAATFYCQSSQSAVVKHIRLCLKACLSANLASTMTRVS